MINVERFARILAKRRKRNPACRACDLPELKSLPRWKEGGISEADKRKAERDIERRARQLREP